MSPYDILIESGAVIYHPENETITTTRENIERLGKFLSEEARRELACLPWWKRLFYS